MPEKEQTILVADDDHASRLITEKVLTNSGYTVVSAENGKEAIRAFQQYRPNLVVMDIYMPVMDGMKATRRIKQLIGKQFIPVIFLTSSSEERVLARCLAAGGDDFITKPVSPLVLKTKIDSLLRLQNHEKSVDATNRELRNRLEHVETEIEIAERILYKIAHSFPATPDNIRYYCSPKQLTSGDIFLAAELPGSRQYLVLGDFTGHGLSAALGTLLVSEAFYSMAASGKSLEQVLRTINARLKEATPGDYFLAALAVELDHRQRTLQCWNGSMPPLLEYRPARGIVERIGSNNLPLGIVTNDGFEYNTSHCKLNADSRLYLYSDGLIETCNTQGKMFGGEQLDALLSEDSRADGVFDTIIDTLCEFRAGTVHRDDTTLVEVKLR